MHEVDYEQNDYIYAAMIRAVRFGHASDLLETMYYCKSLSYSEQEERNFEDGYPAGFPDAHYSFERISRAPEIIDILIKHFSVFKWTESQGYDGCTLSKVLSLVSKESDQDSFNHAAASYVSRGQAMPLDEISAYYDQVFPFMAKVLGTVDAETRASVIDDVFFSGYKSPLVKSLEALLENRDHKGHAQWVDAIYAYTDLKDAQTIINSQLDAALRQNSNLRGLRFTADFLRQVKGLDQALYDDKLKAVKNNRFSRDNGEAALLLTLLDEPIPDKWQIIPAVKAVPAILARATPAEDHIATLAKLCLQEMGDTLGSARPRLNSTVYAQLKPLLKMTAAIEGNGDADAQDNLSEGQAYKLATLFGTLRKADSFIRHHAQPGRQPVHDVCLFNLPYEGHWTPDIWGNLAIRYGHAVTKYLGFAPKVEDFVHDLNRRRRAINLDRLGKTGAGINDRTLRLPELKPAMLRAIVNRIGYARSRENKQAADLCLRLGVEASYFNKTLDLLTTFEKAAKKPRDRMPTITIDGKDLGLEGHKFSRVARGDVLNLWIGKVVNCCNHLAGEGSQMARAQFEGSTNALYIIRDSRNRPEAKLSGWLSTQSTIVFNAWERLSAEQDFLMTRFVMAAGIEILKKYPRIREVRLGAGPINKAAVPFAFAEDTHTPISKDAWTGDSHTQFVIASRGRLPQARAMLAGEVKRLMGAEKVRIKMTYEERQAAEAPHLD